MRVTASRPTFSQRLQSLPAEVNDFFENDEELALIRQSRADHRLRRVKASWKLLRQSFLQLKTKSDNEVVVAIRELLAFGQELVGQDTSEDSSMAAAVYLFWLFRPTETEYEDKRISASLRFADQMRDLRSRFAGVTPVFIEKASAHVIEMWSWLSAEDRALLEVQRTELEDVFDEKKETIKGVSAEFLCVLSDPMFVADEMEIEEESQLFSAKKDTGPQISFLASALSATKLSQRKQAMGGVSGGEKSTEGGATGGKKSSVSPTWLRNEVERVLHSSGNPLQLTTDELVSLVNTILDSTSSDTVLESQLYEILGDAFLELIPEIIKNRKSIVKHLTLGALQDDDDIGINGVANAAAIRANVRKRQTQNPQFGDTVIVKTEQEIALEKKMAKDSKKYQKLVSKSMDISEEERLSMEFIHKMQQHNWRAEMDDVLQQPMFPRATTSERVEQLPNVYDAFAAAKKHSAFVGDAKVFLPVSCHRENNQQYEQVTLPFSKSECPPVNRLAIERLDDLCRTVFSGVKELNVIQSLVYETVYKSNENMLICAPTGAGKTNVAMLACLHQIKQHIENGVVQNNFKIVYVAPMKALAGEMVSNFGKRLQPLGIVVKELTGDMQLSKGEIVKTHMLVTTPEKWDVVTRKSTGDVQLMQLVKLLILDEVHLLHGDRGPVLEALVARTLRQVESSQSMIRIIGLSATLPNYVDVATFLRVNHRTGLYFFDNRFRPVPLTQSFVGVKALSNLQQMNDMNELCFMKTLDVLQRGGQVMIFVHSRNSTVKTARALRDLANQRGKQACFQADKNNSQYGIAEKQVQHSRNAAVKELFPCGLAIHHAGMLRQDRNLVERMFSQGLVNVLVCTATLAWGVNLPARAVIIRGTDIYDSKHGNFVDLGILDVMQIFGRAGRPQFDSQGEATIITTHAKLRQYLSLLTCQFPIESNFHMNLTDNLNAEISLGTVTTVEEAIEWLSYTYLFVRMRKNPLVYGLKFNAEAHDPTLMEHRRQLIDGAARKLDSARMIRYNERAGTLDATDLGRTASHFYIKYETVERFQEVIQHATLTDGDLFNTIAHAQEFDQLQVREDEMDELDELHSHACMLKVPGGSENSHGKVNILLQNHIAKGSVDSFSLISDQSYIVQNGSRIFRALFEMVLRKNRAVMARRLLTLSKVVERQMWYFNSPLRQFPEISLTVIREVEKRRLTISRLREETPIDIGKMLHKPALGVLLHRCATQVPRLIIEPSISPITRTVLKVSLRIKADFVWNDRVHKTSEAFWIWIEDPTSDHITHYEYFILSKKQAVREEPQLLVFTIPISEPLPSQYIVHVDSDHWLGSDDEITLNFQHLILPERHPPHTELLDLQPLPVSALKNSMYEVLYRFDHFNPIQTQIFHTLYHTDNNVLLGAPTGSGKTIAAEIAMFRVFNEYPGSKVVYIAPLKALVRERMDDWKVRLKQKLGRNIAELTGDVTPDFGTIAQSDVIVTTPEKWDGISRSWATRSYVRQVALIIIDEIHLLGEDRGPVLEVIVSRANFISAYTKHSVRIIGLSTALANARDLADWLGIERVGLYNFKPSVRPVQLEVHVQGFPGKHYCPRMALMNKPAFRAIQQYSPTKPVLIFVSSRRQTRLTAIDLITFLATENNPKQWLHIPDQQMENVLGGIRDQNLKLALEFGIGLHHAGLQERDRNTVEELFVNQKIQVLIATSTLAWGVNFPAHLVIVKGTEYYDGKTSRYVDFPITDVLQMIGRAGRPQYDDHGVAVVLVHDQKKAFYHKFLYEPFPVESSLLKVLPDHMNAEIVAGTLTSTQDCMEYMTWTYFFRRLLQNPSYYELADVSAASLNDYLSGLISSSLDKLVRSACIVIDDQDGRSLSATPLGKISSYYYISHETVRLLHESLHAAMKPEDVLRLMSEVKEYAELPVRHNEDLMNQEFSRQCPLPVERSGFDSPHTKAFLLFQGHLSQLTLPCADYLTDLKSILDQSTRILQAMVDIVASRGWLITTLSCMTLMGMLVQARWHYDNTLTTLHAVDHRLVYMFQKVNMPSLPEAVHQIQKSREAIVQLDKSLSLELDPITRRKIMENLQQLPRIQLQLFLDSDEEEGCRRSLEGVRVRIEQVVGAVPSEFWIPVESEATYVLSVQMRRMPSKTTARDIDARALGGEEGDGIAASSSSRHRWRRAPRAVTPRSPKPKDESWFIVLGYREKRDLVAMRRITGSFGTVTHQLLFSAPSAVGRAILTFYLMSDCYLGLDQEYSIYLDVKERESSAIPPPPPGFSASSLKKSFSRESFKESTKPNEKYESIFD